MPKFTMRIRVTNKSGVPVSAHVGASLVGVDDWVEYYNTSDDVKKTFNLGITDVVRYLNTDLGAYQKYDLVVALWEGEKTIGTGTKYTSVTLKNAVEKKKKKITVKLALSVQKFYPSLFNEE